MKEYHAPFVVELVGEDLYSIVAVHTNGYKAQYGWKLIREELEELMLSIQKALKE